jgi:hypothetical protein
LGCVCVDLKKKNNKKKIKNNNVKANNTQWSRLNGNINRKREDLKQL